jgi:hypothetical protein
MQSATTFPEVTPIPAVWFSHICSSRLDLTGSARTRLPFICPNGSRAATASCGDRWMSWLLDVNIVEVWSYFFMTRRRLTWR